MNLLELIINYFRPQVEIKKRNQIIKKETASNAADEALRKLFLK